MIFKKEISLGTIVTIVGYLVAALFFVFQTRAELDTVKVEMRLQFESLKEDTNRLERNLQFLNERFNYTNSFTGPVPPVNAPIKK